MFQAGRIPDNAQVIFVADAYASEYEGGAELTTEALIKSSPYVVHKIKSQDLTLEMLKQGIDRFWVFANFANVNKQLIPSVIGNLKYSILEYDYKFCKYRSIEKHVQTEGSCNCENEMLGKMVSAFYLAAQGVWWMSEAQRDIYFERFPFLKEGNNVVLSSVFDNETLDYLKELRIKYAQQTRQSWVVLASPSWIKGAEESLEYCKKNSWPIDRVWDLPYRETLEMLAKAEGFCYLPKGNDTCPRMVIEAKLLGCKLELNDFVQHKNETWFATSDLDMIETKLRQSSGVFWSGIKQMIEHKPAISGYMTTYNCMKQGYPYLKAIESMLQFCDEVCVVDGGSTDGTWEELAHRALTEPKLVLNKVQRDWNDPQFAVFDGLQKAEARAMCTKDFCWQMDSDEIVHEDDVAKIIELAGKLPSDAVMIALPVIEYWGGEDKVRIDVTPWKWRLSRNLSNITHGVPGDMRVPDTRGSVGYIAREGTDGCDIIFRDNLGRVPFITFYGGDIDNVRKAAMSGNAQALEQYSTWFKAVVTNLPGVHHYSWFDMGRKIRLYRDYWTKHWNSLYGKSLDDTGENNMMFDVPWSQVTDQMIDELADELKVKLGGWVWHRKWDHKTTTPFMASPRSQPALMSRMK